VSVRRELLLEDSTLREGEQSPGVAFTPEEKLRIAQLLDQLGIDAIEVGMAAMGGPEAEGIDRVLGAGLGLRVIGWNRGRRSDLESSFERGLDSVHIGLPASDKHLDEKFGKSRAWVIETMQELVAYAKSQGAWVSVSAEDVGRATPEFLVEYAQAVAAAGADRLRMSDTVGVLDPFKAHALWQTVTSAVPIPVQAHMHNDMGLATANTLAAVRGGARHVHMTVNGLGERAGIAPLEEVVVGLTYHHGLELGLRLEMLHELCHYVAEASGRPIPANKPVSGAAAFSHESGIHVEGTLKASSAFEPFPPDMVGATRRIVIGKHSGTSALRHVLGEAGVDADDQHLPRTLERVRYEATRRKCTLEPDEVLDIYRDAEREALGAHSG
jgi:homocitrate synthase NifV